MHWIFALSLMAAACTKRNPAACCETAAECTALGNGTAVSPVFCATGSCVGFTCVDNGSCDGPEDCQAPESCDQMVCQQLVVDAPPPPAYDLAYPNVWRRSVVDELPFDLMIVNTTDHPIQMSSLILTSVTDDHPLATVRMKLGSLSSAVPVGMAGGSIVPIAEPLLIDSGLVTEPRADTMTSYLAYEIVDTPGGTYDIAADVGLELDGVAAQLHFVVHMVTGPTIFAQPELATRTVVVRP